MTAAAAAHSVQQLCKMPQPCGMCQILCNALEAAHSTLLHFKFRSYTLKATMPPNAAAMCSVLVLARHQQMMPVTAYQSMRQSTACSNHPSCSCAALLLLTPNLKPQRPDCSDQHTQWQLITSRTSHCRQYTAVHFQGDLAPQIFNML
jgi:hypothetical protein